MSLLSRLGSLARTLARDPQIRRGVTRLGREALETVREGRRDAPQEARRPGASDSPARRTDTPDRPGPESAGQRSSDDAESAGALHDRTGSDPLALEYAPREDDHADPGEIAWAWVPFEEDITRGKDRPVLVLGHEDAAVGGRDGSGDVLIALMLTSRDRAATGGVSTDEHGATWVDIGAGDWDAQGRPSEVRADRLLRIAPGTVRREGARLDRDRYDRVAAAVRQVHGW